MAIQDRNLTAGTRLRGTYKQDAYFCDVETTDEGKLAFVLEDGRRFKSTSSAASALMNGKAVNGWIFWSVDGSSPAGAEMPATASEATKTGKSLKVIYRNPNQLGIAAGKTRYFCRARMKGFVAGGASEPETCPEGHRSDSRESESATQPSVEMTEAGE